MNRNILLLILTIFFSCSCEQDKLKSDIYSVVKQTILEENKDNQTIKIAGLDTIIFNDYKIDPKPIGDFGIDTSESVTILSFNTWESSGFKFDKYFAPQDLDYLFQQLHSQEIVSWDKDKLPDIEFVDSSYLNVDTMNTPNTRTWNLFRDSVYNYLSISEPIFNNSREKALVGLSIYLQDYYVQRVMEFNLDDNQNWKIVSKYNLLFKLLLEETDTTSVTTTIYLNGFYE